MKAENICKPPEAPKCESVHPSEAYMCQEPPGHDGPHKASSEERGGGPCFTVFSAPVPAKCKAVNLAANCVCELEDGHAGDHHAGKWAWNRNDSDEKGWCCELPDGHAGKHRCGDYEWEHGYQEPAPPPSDRGPSLSPDGSKLRLTLRGGTGDFEFEMPVAEAVKLRDALNAIFGPPLTTIVYQPQFVQQPQQPPSLTPGYTPPSYVGDPPGWWTATLTWCGPTGIESQGGK